MKKGLIILSLMLGVNNTYGNTLIKGNISDSYPYLFQEITNRYAKYGYIPFPSKEYISRIVTINHLEYFEDISNHHPIDLALYKSLNAVAKLSLEYFDKSTGAYRFKLSLIPKYFDDYSINSMKPNKKHTTYPKLLWIKFNNKKYLYIDGHADINKNKKYNLPASIHANQDSDFTISLDDSGQIILTPAHKISVIASIQE